MKPSLFTSVLLSAVFVIAACTQRQQPKVFINELSSDDSLSMAMGNSETAVYHSEALGLDISYPSFLRHMYVADEEQEVFMYEDVSLSVMEQRLDESITRSAGQQLMGMGAELVKSTDRYSIHTGQDGALEYYGKVIDDSARIVTILLRYPPEQAHAVAPLRELVDTFDIVSAAK